MSIWDNFETPKNQTKFMGVGEHIVTIESVFENPEKNYSSLLFSNAARETVTDYFYATSAALWKVGALASALVITPGTKISQWFNIKFLIGKKLVITVAVTNFNGSKKTVVKDYKQYTPKMVPSTASSKTSETSLEEDIF